MLRTLFMLTLAHALAFTSVAAASAEDIGWPRSFEADGHAVVVYQPQVEEWKDHETLEFLMAVSVLPDGADHRTYGVLEVRANTKINHEERTVLLTQLVLTMQFPDTDAATAKGLETIVRTALPDKETLVVDLDRLITYVHASDVQTRDIKINLDPPPIFYSAEPAVLVIFMGEPKFKPIEGTNLLFAVNTNWDVFLETGSSRYHLRVEDGWLVSSDPKSGNWRPTSALPKDISKLPDEENWTEVRKHVPGKMMAKAPRVLVSTQPAELILTEGTPELTPIAGTDLMYYTNTQSDLFLNIKDGRQYLLVAGRWFRAAGLEGPWEAATLDLPETFALIPEDHPKSAVLASVPGTSQAQEAIAQASIPQKATVKRSETTVTVVYEGEPAFRVIKGSTKVYYATNTTYSVLRVDAHYYCCENGIWFVSTKPTGSWVVCAEVPDAIYTIPATSPYHNVTYVHVYDSTPDTVVVGYTAGYTGAYVANGLLMFGAGYWLGHELADDHDWNVWCTWRYPPAYYSYGCAARYSYHYGRYARGAAYYGPYGGAGYGARYNPVTGTYSRGARAYGRYGSAGVASAYNPWTGTRARGAYVSGPRGVSAAGRAYNPRTGRGAATSQARTPYGSWGRSVVSDGRDWARFGHRSGPGGATAGFETSGGAKGAVHRGATGWTYAGRTASGDVYAGRDGQVYRRGQGNDWHSHSNATRQWSQTGFAADDRTRGRAGTQSGVSRSVPGQAGVRDRGAGPDGARRPVRGTDREGAAKPSGRGDEKKSRAASDSTKSGGRSRDSARRLSRDSRSRARGDRLSSRSRSSRSGGARAPRSRGGRRP